MKKVLYICYFSLREPLVRTQVVAYLTEIAKYGYDIHLLTFEADPAYWTAEREDAAVAELREAGIKWHRLVYHKRPSVPATVFDIINGARVVRKLIKRERLDLLHCRVHVPALMAAIARKFSRRKPKILFDIRGFFPEEYTDAGIWKPNGVIYRTVKRVERWLLREADGFVVLTEKAREIMFSKDGHADERPLEVIPCCVDLDRFELADAASRRAAREKLGVTDRYVIAYVGSFGGWYLSDEMFDLFAAARDADPTTFVMILTQRDSAVAAERLTSMGFKDEDFLVRSVPPSAIPEHLIAADAAVSFIKRCYSKQASSPTKNAEYLACGLPIIANSGVGDVDAQIVEDGVGVVVDGFSPDEYRAAIKAIKAMGDVAERCRASAKERFDLAAVGGTRYRRLYKELLG